MSNFKNDLDQNFEQKTNALSIEKKLNKFGITNINDFVTAIFEMGCTDEEAANNIYKLFPQLNINKILDFVKYYSWQ